MPPSPLRCPVTQTVTRPCGPVVALARSNTADASLSAAPTNALAIFPKFPVAIADPTFSTFVTVVATTWTTAVATLSTAANHGAEEVTMPPLELPGCADEVGVPRAGRVYRSAVGVLVVKGDEEGEELFEKGRSLGGEISQGVVQGGIEVFVDGVARDSRY
jgi:hypothetical protein